MATSTIFVHSTNIPYSFDGVIYDKGMAGGDDRNNTKPFYIFFKHDETQTIDMRVTMTVFLGSVTTIKKLHCEFS